MITLPKFEYAGFKTVERIKAGIVVERVGPYPNLILDSGLDLLGSDRFTFANVMVAGSGSSEPIPAQTQLINKVGGYATSGSPGAVIKNTELGYISQTRVYTGGIGTFVGNISEIGIGPNTTGLGLFSRSLIKDVEGNPTTITLLSDEQLRVTYELRVYQPTGDTFLGVINGHEVTIRPAVVDTLRVGTGWTQKWKWAVYFGENDNGLPFGIPLPPEANAAAALAVYAGPIGSITEMPNGTPNYLNANAMIGRNYTPGSFEMELTITIPIGSGNIAGGIGAMALVMGGAVFQFGFSPKLPKNNENRLTFGVKYSWGRYE